MKRKLEKANEKTEKLASLNKEKLKNAGKVFIERSAEGLGRTIFPAAITVTTGRNIMNSFKKIEDKRHTMQEDMSNRIVININPGSKRSIKKQVSQQLDKELASNKVNKAITKTASSKLNDILQEIRDENEIMKPKKKLQGKKIHLGNGIKKQFSMNEMHGINPMNPQF